MRLSSSPFRLILALVAALLLLHLGQSGAQVHAGGLNVDQGDAGCSDATGTPYCTIGGAVGDAVSGDSINVLPGTYAESVDLGGMATPGAISLRAVDAGGQPTEGIVTIDSPAGPAITNSVAPFPGTIFIDGFITNSPDDAGIGLSIGGTLTIFNVISNGNGGDGIRVNGNDNTITVSDSMLNDNEGDGFNPFNTSAHLTVTNVTTNGNAEDGMELNGSGSVSVSDSTANGNLGTVFGGNGIVTLATGSVTMTHVTANENAGDGVFTEGLAAASVTVNDSTGNDNGESGFDLEAAGDVTIKASEAHRNFSDGFQVNTGGVVTISDTNADRNRDGFDVEEAASLTVTNTHAQFSGDDGHELEAIGDIEITGSSSHDNLDDGFEVDSDATITIERSSANGNTDDGVNIDHRTGSLTGTSVVDSVFIGNGGEALDYGEAYTGAGPREALRNIICGNTAGGLDSDAPTTLDATANWWGDSSGPFHPVNNPTGTGDAVADGTNGSSGTVDFTPWIDTISGTGDPATQGQTTLVTFEFTGGGSTLLDGPGDPDGPPVFAATTDNGTVTTSGFVVGGVLEVMLTPENAGTATVTVNGPCDLGDATGGNSVEVDVAAGTQLVWGDHNCSDSADPIDSLLTLRFDAGLDTNTGDCPGFGQVVDVQNASLHPWGDVDCGGDVTPIDSLKLLRFDAGLSASQQPGCPTIGAAVTVTG